jgi:hypothetical protein
VRARTGLSSLLLLLLAAAACTGTAGGAGPARPDPAGHHAVRLAAPAAPKASPQQRRAQFEQLLGQHTLIAVRLMRSVVTAAPQVRQAAVKSLQDNTSALRQLVAAAYGPPQGDRFNQLWLDHIAELSAYATGLASHDQAAMQQARGALTAYCTAYGNWFAGASHGRVRAADATAAVRMHVEDLLDQVDAYAAHDYDRAYRIEREAYERMFTAGATLAKASLTPELAVGVDTPPEKLRSGFAMLLGEHFELIVDAQRASFAGSPEFQAAAAQVNANTAALTQAMDAIVGPRKAAGFQSGWADHVDGLMADTAAVAGQDQAGKAAATKRLNTFAVQLAAYFSGIVRHQVSVVPLTAAITMHDTHLTGQVDAYAARNYERAEQLELEGYRQMLDVADTLVRAIQRTVQPGLPVGGPRTGGGGTATRRR